MASELQRIVDSIARRLQRAAAIDDPRLRLQVYSPHIGPVDQTRLTSILQREAPGEVAEWVRSTGIEAAEGPFRLPANPQFDLLARVGAPIRCQDLHLGYLWLIDAEESLTEDDLAELQTAADRAGVVMYRERLVAELQRGQERDVARDLLTGDDAKRAVAAARAAEERLFVDTAAVVAVVAVRPVDGPLHDPHRVAVEHALGVCRRTSESGRVLTLARADHGVLVLSPADAQVARRGPAAVAELARSDVLDRLGTDAVRVLVGIGGRVDGLAEVTTSYRQAREALRVAEVVRSFDDVAEWGRLGVYGLLSRLPQEELTRDLLHPGVVALLEVGEDRMLLRTLETYLDLAGDAKATSAALVLHRTSLYYRLRRIQEVSGTDLSNGDDRLALHLGLKIGRLIGLIT